METPSTIGVRSVEQVRELQALIARGGETTSQRAAVSAAVDWAVEAMQGGGAFYDCEALAATMRRRTIEAVVSNLETTLAAFDKAARYSVVGDLATGNIEVTRANSNHSRTLILVERRDAAKERTHDEYAENHATA